MDVGVRGLLGGEHPREHVARICTLLRVFRELSLSERERLDLRSGDHQIGAQGVRGLKCGGQLLAGRPIAARSRPKIESSIGDAVFGIRSMMQSVEARRLGNTGPAG